MAARRETGTSEGRGREQQDRTTGGTSTQAGGSAAGQGASASTSQAGSRADQERQMPVSRDAGRQAGQRGTAVAGPQSFLPSLLAAPPGLFASAFMSNPYGFMQRMSEEMDRLFQTAGFGGSLPAPLTSGSAAAGRGLATGREGGMWTPQIEVRQRGNELVVRADLPGIKKEDVNVEVNDGMLTISGERRQEDTEEREGFYRSERSYGTFYRSIPLPEGVTEDQISASFEDGVLEVVVPTPQQQQPRGRKVQIK